MAHVSTPHQPPRAQVRRLPGPVLAAILVTWVGSALTASTTVLVTALVLWQGDAVFDAFDSGANNPRWWLIYVAVGLVALSGMASLLAMGMFRAKRWAWWGLLVLSVLVIVAGVYLVFFVVPPLVAAFALTVLILLLLPQSRAWARNPRASIGSS